jgi:hypothetical protein
MSLKIKYDFIKIAPFSFKRFKILIINVIICLSFKIMENFKEIINEFVKLKKIIIDLHLSMKYI